MDATELPILMNWNLLIFKRLFNIVYKASSPHETLHKAVRRNNQGALRHVVIGIRAESFAFI